MNASQLALTGDLAEELTPERRLLALPPGIHLDVPEGVYHARVLGFASKSALDQLRRSPARYRAWVAGLVQRDSRAFQVGKAAHCAVLEPERFAREWVLEPDFGNQSYNVNKARRAEWLKTTAADAKYHLKGTEGAAHMGMVRALAAHPTVCALLEGARCELTARWEEFGGIPSKARVDADNRDLLVVPDIKTSEDASPDGFARSVLRYGYHRQEDWYTRGLRALGVDVDGFIFIVVEKDPPHEIGLYQLDEDARALGRLENDRLLRTLATCVERDEWPGYPEDVQRLRLPAWAYR